MGLSWAFGEVEDGAVSGGAGIASLETNLNREDGLGLKEVVVLRDIVDSESNDGLGDDS
jgi:hypothetical protein